MTEIELNWNLTLIELKMKQNEIEFKSNCHDFDDLTLI